MSDKIFNEKINKHADWAGDESTSNLPVSGYRVQEFIKEQLENKFGCLQYDPDNQRYLVFADEENKNLYLENPIDNAGYLLGTFLAPSEYTAKINLISDVYNAILSNRNNYLEFTFDVVNSSNAPTGENVIATYTIYNGNEKTKVTEKYKYGTAVKFKLDDYLKTGVNRVTIQITGETSLVGTTATVTYELVELILKDTLKLNRCVYDSTDTIEIPYYVSGAGIKKMEWFVDGIKQNEDSGDTITQTSLTRTRFIPISNLGAGAHNLQFRSYVELNGTKFYTQTTYVQFAVNDGVSKTPCALYKCKLPIGSVIDVDQPMLVEGLVQYDTYEFEVCGYSPSNINMTLNVFDAYNTITSVNVTNDDIIQVPYRPISFGLENVNIKIIEASREHVSVLKFNVLKSSLSIEEITSGLTLNLSAKGRSNLESATDRSKWVYQNINTTFKNFKWSDQSGWMNDSLLVQKGSSIVVDYQHFISDAKITGNTFEIEFKSYDDVDKNPNDVLLSCNVEGTGITVTGTKIILKSLAGKTVSTYYKENEYNRIAFVIHKSEGDNLQRMMFIYVNGIISSISDYIATDSFVNNSKIKIGGIHTSIGVRNIRCYNRALTAEECLNNTMLYKSNINDMLDMYDKNDVYITGTNKFDFDKIASKVPVMLCTGKIKELLETNDKGHTIYIDEIEFINMQDPDAYFKGQNVRMKPQGTSSMAYPIKNFRFYLKYGTVQDKDGKTINTTRIKEGSIPVNTFCLKADYAESSGTHNTGVARLWNDLFKNVQVNNEYVCRTNAQKAALANGYKYDVRTAIDGYPIVMFYRETENSEWVFLGHYNYNNDKSTENVFGFKDIPGFDNTNMACWEHLNNTHHIGLFTDISDFDAINPETSEPVWCDSFEARYPENFSDHHLQALKNFANWVNSTKDNLEKFKAEKSQHLNLNLMAAYYVYLMRFGAVDQVVKNAMLTTEDGQHYYYIHYDNDTVLGLRNDGLQAYPPTITRQSLDTDYTEDVYCYAGHDSVLWNNLEQDDEFMRLVYEIDYALYQSGLSYDKVIEMFDSKQMGKWCERIYNEDHKTKYIQPFQDQNINNLFMAQGARQQNRRYWLSNRFSLFDALYASGEYRAKVIEIKSANVPQDTPFTITAGVDSYYGYGINSVVVAAGQKLAENESKTFTTPRQLAIGDPLRIYGAHNIKKLNLINFKPYLAQLNLSNVNHNVLGSQFDELILGGNTNEDTATNLALKEISGLKSALKLKNLNIRGYKGLTAIDLSEHKQIERIEAQNTNVGSILLAKDAPIKYFAIEKPQTINLVGCTLLTDFICNNTSELVEVQIENGIGVDVKPFVMNWISTLDKPSYLTSLKLNNLDWSMTFEQLKMMVDKIGTLSLKGKITLDRCSTEIIDFIQTHFGDGAFDPQGTLYFNLPETVELIGSYNVLLPANTYQFTANVFPSDKDNGVIWTIDKESVASINSESGLLTITNNVERETLLTIRATSKNNAEIYTEKSIMIAGEVTIIGDDSIYEGQKSYRYEFVKEDGSSTSDIPTNYHYAFTWNIQKGNDITNITELETIGDTFNILATELFADANKTIQIECTAEIIDVSTNKMHNYTVSKNVILKPYSYKTYSIEHETLSGIGPFKFTLIEVGETLEGNTLKGAHDFNVSLAEPTDDVIINKVSDTEFTLKLKSSIDLINTVNVEILKANDVLYQTITKNIIIKNSEDTYPYFYVKNYFSDNMYAIDDVYCDKIEIVYYGDYNVTDFVMDWQILSNNFEEGKYTIEKTNDYFKIIPHASMFNDINPNSYKGKTIRVQPVLKSATGEVISYSNEGKSSYSLKGYQNDKMISGWQKELGGTIASKNGFIIRPNDEFIYLTSTYEKLGYLLFALKTKGADKVIEYEVNEDLMYHKTIPYLEFVGIDDTLADWDSPELIKCYLKFRVKQTPPEGTKINILFCENGYNPGYATAKLISYSDENIVGSKFTDPDLYKFMSDNSYSSNDIILKSDCEKPTEISSTIFLHDPKNFGKTLDLRILKYFTNVTTIGNSSNPIFAANDFCAGIYYLTLPPNLTTINKIIGDYANLKINYFDLNGARLTTIASFKFVTIYSKVIFPNTLTSAKNAFENSHFKGGVGFEVGYKNSAAVTGNANVHNEFDITNFCDTNIIEWYDATKLCNVTEIKFPDNVDTYKKFQISNNIPYRLITNNVENWMGSFTDYFFDNMLYDVKFTKSIKANNQGYFFVNCSSIRKITIDVSNIEKGNLLALFFNCSSLKEINIKIDFNKLNANFGDYSVLNIVSGCYVVEKINFVGIDKLTDIRNICVSSTQNFKGFDLSNVTKVTTTNTLFKQCQGLDLETLNVSNNNLFTLIDGCKLVYSSNNQPMMYFYTDVERFNNSDYEFTIASNIDSAISIMMDPNIKFNSWTWNFPQSSPLYSCPTYVGELPLNFKTKKLAFKSIVALPKIRVGRGYIDEIDFTQSICPTIDEMFEVKNLRSITFNPETTNLGFYGIHNMPDLESIKFGTTSFENQLMTFHVCPKLKTIQIPFNDATKLIMKDWSGGSTEEGVVKTIYVPADSTGFETHTDLTKYCNQYNWTLSKSL